jgi:hypothetical protein
MTTYNHRNFILQNDKPIKNIVMVIMIIVLVIVMAIVIAIALALALAMEIPYRYKNLNQEQYIEIISCLRNDIRKNSGVLAKQVNRNPGNNYSSTSQNRPELGLDMSKLDGVMSFDPDQMTIDVGSATTFFDITMLTIPYGLIPAVVPELRTITVGGAISGVGCESSSFRYGLVHDNIIEMDVLLSDGTLMTITPDTHRDLWNSLPNSYGSIAYITKAKLSLIRSKSHVRIVSIKVSRHNLFDQIKESTKKPSVDFVEGFVFDPNNCRVVEAYFTNDSRECLRIPQDVIYTESIDSIKTLKTFDYIWRHDTHPFWSLDNHPIFFNPLIRKTFGRKLLNHHTLRTLSLWRSQIQEKLGRDIKTRNIVQDIGIPIENCENFVDWQLKKIGVCPLWICPIRNLTDTSCFGIPPNHLYCDIGIFGNIEEGRKESELVREIEKKMLQLGGSKCFYSNNYFSQKEFESSINYLEYIRIKNIYDPNGYFKALESKACIGI